MKIFKKVKKQQSIVFYLFGLKIFSFFSKKEAFKQIKKEIEILQYALVDPNGLGRLFLLMHHAHVKKQYEHIFIKTKPSDIVIDCGGHTGAFTDIVAYKQATIHTFEPNPELFEILSEKYKNAENVTLYNQAVWDKEGELPFYQNKNENADFYSATQAASICSDETKKLKKEAKTIVKVIDLTTFIKEILEKNQKIHILKIDIEGAEFELLEKIIKEKLYEHISCIFCETHERIIKNGHKKLKNLKMLLKENNIKNIYLDWI